MPSEVKRQSKKLAAADNADTMANILRRKRMDKLRSCLRWALGEAKSWRGSMTGNSDPRYLEEFDKRVRKCEDALKDR